jgi:fructokinase
MRIGIDLGGTKTEGVILDRGGKELVRRRYPTPRAEGYEAILNTIGSLITELDQFAGHQCTVGVCTPGAVSQVNGCLKNSNTVCMNGRPVASDLENLIGRPVRLENDANCFALAEAIDGAGKNAGSVFGIILGTGVGAGIVINRTLFKGLHHIAGEWGHNVLEADGPLCYCGNNGCVETFLSGPGLVAEYVRQGGDTSVDATTVATRAAHDPTAGEALNVFLDRFGRALAMVINILDPDLVVLGGGLSKIERLYIEGRQRTALYVFNEDFRTPIVSNNHGDSGGVRGAALLWPE